MKRADTPECVACGSCCLSERQDYLELFKVDRDRMDSGARQHTRSDGARRFMKIEQGRCTALRIDSIAQQLRCAIYPMRPDVCRWLERGSGACFEQITGKAERARLLLTTS